MKTTLRSGVTSTERVAVDERRTISFLGERLRVYSTPSMVEDIEYAAHRLISAHLDDGEGSVGVHVSVDHLGATPLGQWVDVVVRVSEVDGRRVSLDAEVRDAQEIVGRGRHVRFVIDVARHAARLDQKAMKY